MVAFVRFGYRHRAKLSHTKARTERMSPFTSALREHRNYEAAEAELDPAGVEIDDRDIVESTGKDSHRVWLERWNAAWQSWRTEDAELIPVGDETVVALFRMIATGKGSGIELAR